MPVYNGMPYLPAAVESILSQSFSDFEFIIVNDCSTDNSLEYLMGLRDERVKVISLEKNLGVTAALQVGIKLVSGKYVARLDADDVAKQERLSQQVEFMEANPEIGLLGSSYELIDSNGTFIRYVDISRDDIEIRWRLLFKNPFFHSTVMFRHDMVKEHQLNYTRKYGEDYQLWIDILQYCKGAIVQEPLIQYRIHQHSWTFTKGSEQVQAAYEIAGKEVNRYLLVSAEQIERMIDFARGKPFDKSLSETIKPLYVQLLESFVSKNRELIHRRFIWNRVWDLKRRMGTGFVFVHSLTFFFPIMFQSKSG
jgi:hypothetical protein